jgi:hypothetical protein
MPVPSSRTLRETSPFSASEEMVASPRQTHPKSYSSAPRNLGDVQVEVFVDWSAFQS